MSMTIREFCDKHAAVVCGQTQAFRDGIKRITDKHTVIQELAQAAKQGE